MTERNSDPLPSFTDYSPHAVGVRLNLFVFWDVTLVIISIETYCLMARCLKSECTVEEGEALADLFSAKPDLRQEYEILRNYFRHNSSNKLHTKPTEQPCLQNKFDGITKKLTDGGFL